MRIRVNVLAPGPTSTPGGRPTGAIISPWSDSLVVRGRLVDVIVTEAFDAIARDAEDEAWLSSNKSDKLPSPSVTVARFEINGLSLRSL